MRPTDPAARTPLRLTFRFDEEHVKLVSARPFPGRVPVSDPTDDARDRAGFWCEVRDAAGRVVFRRVLADPRAAREVFPQGDRPSVARAPTIPGNGTFAVIVPDPGGAATVALCDGDAELARFALPETG